MQRKSLFKRPIFFIFLFPSDHKRGNPSRSSGVCFCSFTFIRKIIVEFVPSVIWSEEAQNQNGNSGDVSFFFPLNPPDREDVRFGGVLIKIKRGRERGELWLMKDLNRNKTPPQDADTHSITGMMIMMMRISASGCRCTDTTREDFLSRLLTSPCPRLRHWTSVDCFCSGAHVSHHQSVSQHFLLIKRCCHQQLRLGRRM